NGGWKELVNGMETKLFPVETVSWDEAMTFCEALSKLPEEKQAGRIYHLPSEAEWEYACRGGATSSAPYHFGASLSSNQANFEDFEDTPLDRPCPVGRYPANPFGLFDMHGNIWEWCFDWADENSYKNSTNRDPRGPDHGDRRVLRGGSWDSF